MQISIVIIAHLKQRYLRACLAGMNALTFPRDRFEVIVVNDGSPDSTGEFLDAYRPAYRFRAIHKDNGGIASARNAGIDAAAGELLVMLDNDCVLAPDTLSRLWQSYRRFPDGLHIARISYVDIAHVPAVMAGLERGDYSLFTRYRTLEPAAKNDSLEVILQTIRANLPRLCVGWFSAQGPSVTMSAKRFRQLGGYDSAIRRYGMEDFDLAFRFSIAGGTLHYVPEALIHHLDHGRDQFKTFAEMTSSAQYFYRKHAGRPETPLFMKFLCEALTLREFNNAVASIKGVPPVDDNALNVTFSPYRMIRYRDQQRQSSAGHERTVPIDAREYWSRFLIAKLETVFPAHQGSEPLPRFEADSERNILVVAPHMDDEVIGCGGAIQRYVERGARVTVAFLTSGSGILGPCTSEQRTAATEARIAESRRAAGVLGIEATLYFHLGERQLSRIAIGCDELASLLARASFDAVFVPGPDEFHPDHRVACRWVGDAVRRLPHPPTVYHYEVWGDCKPNRVLELDDEAWGRKMRALDMYATQLQQADYRGIMAFMADRRGACAGRPRARAEAFHRVTPCQA